MDTWIEEDIHNFFEEAFNDNVTKLKYVSLSMIVYNLERYNQIHDQSPDCVEKYCKDILLNCTLQSGQEINLSTSKLALSYGIAAIVVVTCTSQNDNEFGVLSQATEINIESIISKDYHDLRKCLKSEKIRLTGISSEVNKIQQLLTFSKFCNFFSGFQVGVLLHGPPGCGKTSFVKYIAQEFNTIILNLKKTDILKSELGSGPENVKKIFKKAVTLAEEGHVLLFLDELDTLCPNTPHASLGSKQIVSALVHELDSLHNKHISGLLVIAATNDIAAIDTSLRRPGRFAHEILINVPTKAQRMGIINLYTQDMTLSDDIDVGNIALRTPGFVGADLRAVCEEAESKAVNRQNHFLIPKCTVTKEDFDHALHFVSPLTKKTSDCVTDVPCVKWEDIGGLEDIKQEIRQSIEWPLLYPDILSRMDLTSTKGVLLYGPPGCCKTTLVKAAATSCHVTFLSLSGAQVFSPYLGRSEKIISEAFQKARALSPSILFFDEIETLVGKRSSERSSRVQERILATLLNEMDGVGIRLDKKVNTSKLEKEKPTLQQPEKCLEKQNERELSTVASKQQSMPTENTKDFQVMVIGATNRPDMLDAAIMRPGRLDKHIYVPPPDVQARDAILKLYTSKMSTSDLDIHKLSLETEKYTGADLKNLCKEAGLFSLRQILEHQEDCLSYCVTNHHFQLAKKIVRPSL